MIVIREDLDRLGAMKSHERGGKMLGLAVLKIVRSEIILGTAVELRPAGQDSGTRSRRQTGLNSDGRGNRLSPRGVFEVPFKTLW